MRTALLAFALASAPVLPTHAGSPDTAAADCHSGIHRLPDGRLLDVGPSTRGTRWRLLDGTTGMLVERGGLTTSTQGVTGAPDGHVLVLGACDAASISFDGVPATRVAVDARETTFESDGVTLAGRLVLPTGTRAVPVVVLVHGSERTSARRYAHWQRWLPAHGVGVFVYDKRGTGGSTGQYTQDFQQLARDAAQAARTARTLAGAGMAALVYEGESQGGWVVPLAHGIEPAQRLIVGYGLTVSPFEENRSQVLDGLADANLSATDRAEVLEVVAATETLMASGFRDGFDDLARVHRVYGTRPWFHRIRGEFSGDLLAWRPWMLRLAAPIARKRSNPGTPWRHDPLPPLRAADVPMLWVLAGDDREAPPAQTRTDLARLQGEGEAITVLEFPHTDHGMVTFTQAADGSRTVTGVADGYLQAVIDFAREGALQPAAYGTALRTEPAPR